MLVVLVETDQECAAAVLEAEEGEPPDVAQADRVAEARDEEVARVAPPPPLGTRRRRHQEILWWLLSEKSEWFSRIVFNLLLRLIIS